MIISLKNASMVSKDTVVVPFSQIKASIAQCLKNHGYIEEASKKTEKKNVPVLEMKLKYVNGVPVIHDVKRISKSSLRVYMGMRDLHPVKNGTGMTVLSTPKGILSDKEAKKEQVGGEALFMIW
jgi:small subunit ribosomal protein S8